MELSQVKQQQQPLRLQNGKSKINNGSIEIQLEMSKALSQQLRCMTGMLRATSTTTFS